MKTGGGECHAYLCEIIALSAGFEHFLGVYVCRCRCVLNIKSLRGAPPTGAYIVPTCTHICEMSSDLPSLAHVIHMYLRNGHNFECLRDFRRVRISAAADKRDCESLNL